MTMRAVLCLLGLLVGVCLLLGGVVLDSPPVVWSAMGPLGLGAAALGGW